MADTAAAAQELDAGLTAGPAFTPKVTAIVCSYSERRWSLLVRATPSLRAQQYPPDQVVVVVDHNEALLRQARAWLAGEVQVVANEGAQGIAGARNTGVRHAEGEILAFSTTMPKPNRTGWAQ